MAAPQIKICGVTTIDAVQACIAARAEWCGLVFYSPSPRNLTPSDAALLAAAAAGRIGKVGLFVDADDLAIAEAVRAGALDTIQLHGHEPPERAAQIRQRFGLPVWKALPVTSAADVERASDYLGAADLILFDAKTPSGSMPGGMGLSFDWSLVAHWKGPLPWGLAGGLNLTNVAQAAKLTGAPLVDASSGVETAPGMKDTGLIAAFCAAARSG